MAKGQYTGESTGRKPSPIIFSDLKIEDILNHFSSGAIFQDDFTEFGASGNRYTLQEGDATSSIGLIATERFGVCRLAITGTANAECNMQGGINEGVIGDISDAVGSNVKFGFESRIRVSSVADNVCGIVIGMAEEGSAGANLQADTTGVLADKDFIGFRTLQADGNGLDAVHQLAGGAEVVVQDVAQILVANTWYKVGFKFDGAKVYWYVDGVQVGSGVLPAATNFPNAQELHVVIGAKVGSNAALNLDVDWVRAAMAEYV